MFISDYNFCFYLSISFSFPQHIKDIDKSCSSIPQISQSYENHYINLPTPTANIPQPNEAHTTNVVVQPIVNEKPNQSQIVNRRAKREELHNPNKIDIRLRPTYSLIQCIIKQLRMLLTAPISPKIWIFREEEPQKKANRNLKNVTEIQYQELYNVACSFVVKFLRTEQELIHPPQVHYWPIVKKNSPEIRYKDFLDIFGNCFSSGVFVQVSCFCQGLGKEKQNPNITRQNIDKMRVEFSQNIQTVNGPRRPPIPKNPWRSWTHLAKVSDEKHFRAATFTPISKQEQPQEKRKVNKVFINMDSHIVKRIPNTPNNPIPKEITW